MSRPRITAYSTAVARALHSEATVVTEGSNLYSRAYEYFLLNDVRAYLCAYQ